MPKRSHWGWMQGTCVDHHVRVPRSGHRVCGPRLPLKDGSHHKAGGQCSQYCHVQAHAIPTECPSRGKRECDQELPNESYYKCAFLSEADVARIYSVSAKSLKLKSTVLQLEDGTGTLTGFYVGLWGMPDHIRAAVRKVEDFQYDLR